MREVNRLQTTENSRLWYKVSQDGSGDYSGHDIMTPRLHFSLSRLPSSTPYLTFPDLWGISRVQGTEILTLIIPLDGDSSTHNMFLESSFALFSPPPSLLHPILNLCWSAGGIRLVSGHGKPKSYDFTRSAMIFQRSLYFTKPRWHFFLPRHPSFLLRSTWPLLICGGRRVYGSS